MKIRPIYLLVVLAIALVCGYGAVRAETILFVSPTRVNLDEKHKVEVINISNTSEVSRTYKVSLEDLAMGEDGITRQQDGFAYSAKKMVRFFPREFTVAPGESQVIRVMARIGADTPDGEYHVHISFFEDAKEQGPPPSTGSGTSMSAPLAYSTMLPITITKGTVDTKVGWVDPALTKNTKQADTYHFATVLTRQGNGQGRAYIEVIYVPPSGDPQVIGNRRTAYVYREIDKLNYAYDFQLPKDASPSGQIKFRLLSGDPTNPTLVDEKSFAIP